MPDRTIQVAATGRRTADPDEVLVRVSVVASAADAVTARQELTEDTSTMRAALTEAGIADEQLRTEEYRIRHDPPHHGPHRPDAPPDDDQPTQTAIQTFTITTDPDRVGNVIDTAVTNGANRVQNVQFTLSTETRQRLRTTALKDAMAAAREQAETIGESAGLAIESVRTVQTGATGDRSNQQLALDTSEQTTTTIDTPSVAVSVCVSVTYDVMGKE